MEWKITLLGELRVERNGQSYTHFPTRKAGGLLAYLAYYLHRVHSREVLAAIFWPDSDLEAGRKSLRMALSSLRQMLEPSRSEHLPLFLTDRFSLQLNPASVTTDIGALAVALQAAEQADSEKERIECLQVAVDLYGGPLLPGYYEDWIVPEQTRLADRVFQALGRLSELLQQSGNVSQAIEYARRAVDLEPLSEEAHQTLVRLYAVSGQKHAALRQYQQMERLLDEELGITPSADSRALRDRIQKDLVAAVSTAALPVPTPSAPALPDREIAIDSASYLPLPMTRFFGRQEEMAYLLEMLSPGEKTTDSTADSRSHARRYRCRLLTLTGPGGAGKTRLALEVAHALQSAFAGAIWFVPLAEVTDAKLLPERILQALEGPRSVATAPLSQLVQRFSERPSLLILDNFEQLLPEGASLVRQLLEQAPRLICMATTRRPLNLAGEREIPLAPLPLPASSEAPEHLMEYDSVRLFVDRAQAVRPQWQVTPENAPLLAALCRRLEGLPLAIELAAARTRMLTPAQMLEQLAHGFDFLVSTQEGVESRHRTLRATIDWSYRLLSPPLQRLFARLSVFRGGFDSEALQAICFAAEEADLAAAEALDHLAQLQQSSLVITQEQAQYMRFRLLETLREYADEQFSSEERAAVRTRHRNYYLTLAETARLKMQGSEQAAWLDRLEREHENLRAALDGSLTSDAEAGLRLACAISQFWEIRGYLAEGRRYLQELFSLCERVASPLLRARALNALGLMAFGQSDYKAALGFHEKGLALLRNMEEKIGLSSSLNNVGLVLLATGGYAQAREHLEESLALRRELEDRWGIATALNNVGLAAQCQGDYTTARRYYAESLAAHRTLGDKLGMSQALNNLGNIAAKQGDEAAERLFHQESLAICRELGDKRGIAAALNNLGGAADRRQDYAAACQFYEEALALRREIDDRAGIAETLNNLGNIARERGNGTLAGIYLKESLEIRCKLGEKRNIAASLEAFAALALAQEQWERAARLYGFAQAFTEDTLPARPPEERVEYEDNLRRLHQGIDDQTLAAALSEGRSLSLEQAVAYALQEDIVFP